MGGQRNKPAERECKPRDRLHRCRKLLNELDPDRPPPFVKQKEFRWQYRALRERAHLYAERLARAERSSNAEDSALRKAEIAIDLSFRYFHDVLIPKSDPEDGPGAGGDV